MDSLHNVIQQYLADHRLSDLRAWLAQNQWRAKERLLEFVDQVDEALVYFDDGYIDEMGLHKWLFAIWTDYSLSTVISHWSEQASVQQKLRHWVYQPTQRSFTNANSRVTILTA